VISKLRCPYCLRTFRMKDVDWRHPTTNHPRPSPVPAGPRLARIVKRAADRLAPMSMSEYVEGLREGYRPRCPEQGEVLPGDPRRRGLVVGLIGEAGASKSHYLASLVHQLVTYDPLRRFGLEASLSEGCFRDYKERYYDFLFARRQRIPGTPPLLPDGDHSKPIVLEVRDSVRRRVTTLSIFDAAGEDVQTGGKVAAKSPFLFMADVLVFFVDPLCLPKLWALRDLDQDQDLFSTKSRFEMVEQALQGANRRRFKPMKAAVVLAKADTCQEIDGFDDAFLHEPDYLSLVDTVNRLDVERTRVAAFIEAWGGGALVNTLNARFPGCGFHAVSATGCSPEGQHFPFVRPTRCIDPLIVPLLQLGLLDESLDLRQVGVTR
jgi:hypothetical protein